jgi:hypothetical protein
MQGAARLVSALVIRRRHDRGHDDRKRHGRALALPAGVGCALMGYGIPFRGAFSAYISKEALMRIPALTIATVLTAAPVRAQTYDPPYPVCLHVYQQWGAHYYDCSYTSLPQCNASASGRAATCVINPYFAGVEEPRAGYRRHRRVY